MTEGTRSSFCAAALKLPVFATATKARIEAIVSILHDSRKLNRRQAPFSVELARLASLQCRGTGFWLCGQRLVSANAIRRMQCTMFRSRRAHELCGPKHRLQQRFQPILAAWK